MMQPEMQPGTMQSAEQFQYQLQKPIEAVRDAAQEEIAAAIVNLTEQIEDSGELQDFDRKQKRKRPIDRAIGNLQLINGICEQSPSLVEYMKRRRIYVFFSRQNILYRTLRGEDTFFCLEGWNDSLKLSGSALEGVGYVTPELIEDHWDRGYREEIESLANLTVEDIGKTFQKIFKQK